MRKMNKILALFLFTIVIIYSVAKVESQEVCESYVINDYIVEAENCSDYCCGTCNRRYCCGALINRLDQKSCAPNNCTGYYDQLGFYIQPVDCFGLICCGWCDFRFCCSYPTSLLNQSSCPTELPTKKPYSSSSSIKYALFLKKFLINLVVNFSI